MRDNASTSVSFETHTRLHIRRGVEEIGANWAQFGKQVHYPRDPFSHCRDTRFYFQSIGTGKLVVAAASMRTGLVPPTQVLPGGGAWTLGDHTFGNWMSLPAQALPEAISWTLVPE